MESTYSAVVYRARSERQGRNTTQEERKVKTISTAQKMLTYYLYPKTRIAMKKEAENLNKINPNRKRIIEKMLRDNNACTVAIPQIPDGQHSVTELAKIIENVTGITPSYAGGLEDQWFFGFKTEEESRMAAEREVEFKGVRIQLKVAADNKTEIHMSRLPIDMQKEEKGGEALAFIKENLPEGANILKLEKIVEISDQGNEIVTGLTVTVEGQVIPKEPTKLYEEVYKIRFWIQDTCYECFSPEHRLNTCPKLKQRELEQAQKYEAENFIKILKKEIAYKREEQEKYEENGKTRGQIREKIQKQKVDNKNMKNKGRKFKEKKIKSRQQKIFDIRNARANRDWKHIGGKLEEDPIQVEIYEGPSGNEHMHKLPKEIVMRANNETVKKIANLLMAMNWSLREHNLELEDLEAYITSGSTEGYDTSQLEELAKLKKLCWTEDEFHKGLGYNMPVIGMSVGEYLKACHPIVMALKYVAEREVEDFVWNLTDINNYGEDTDDIEDIEERKETREDERMMEKEGRRID